MCWAAAEESSADMSVRAAFREVALALMDWQDPPEPQLHRDVGRYLAFIDAAREKPQAKVYRPVSRQEIPNYVDPYDVAADWAERA